VSLGFFVAHQTEGRTRLRLIEMPADPAAFAAAAERIAAIEQVAEVQPRLETGSLVILHPAMGPTALLQALPAAGIELQSEPERLARPALVPFRERLDRADGLVREVSHGAADLRTLAFLAAGGLAVMQTLRGQTLGNAASFLWYAYNLARPPSDRIP
jgi:hypothetical protein